MRVLYTVWTLLLLAPALPVPAHAASSQTTVTASWYGAKFAGRIMADGKKFDPEDPTIAAHRTLPLGTPLFVTNPATGRILVVVVRDRGPYVDGRSLDLSQAAAGVLGFKSKGVAKLEVELFAK